MKRFVSFLTVFAALVIATPLTAAICPTTVNTNTDCGYLITIGLGGAITGAPVPGANPYDGGDDALIGVINNSGAVYTGSFTLSGSGNGGGVFQFDGDGICTYVAAAYCATAPTGYEGPLTRFSGINATGTLGTVTITGLGIGATTFFSLEGSPASITTIGVNTPEPATYALIGLGSVLTMLATKRRKRT